MEWRPWYYNGTLNPIKSVAGFYPLMVEGMPKDKIDAIVRMLQTPDFWTAVPVPTVAVSTPGFSTDLDRGPMWEQQNVYPSGLVPDALFSMFFFLQLFRFVNVSRGLRTVWVLM